MYHNKYIDFQKPINLYNVFDKVGSPSSELEMALIGGLSIIHDLKGCYTEETIDLPGLDGTYKSFRYDFGLVTSESYLDGKSVHVRLEGNGGQHFWLGEQDPLKFKEQQYNFYQKQMASDVPIININMCIKGTGAAKNAARRKSYIKLVESGVLEKAIITAKLYRKHINITLCDDLILRPSKCGIEEVDTYVYNMLANPNYKIKV